MLPTAVRHASHAHVVQQDDGDPHGGSGGDRSGRIDLEGDDGDRSHVEATHISIG
jgi:hypothetical protein